MYNLVQYWHFQMFEGARTPGYVPGDIFAAAKREKNKLYLKARLTVTKHSSTSPHGFSICLRSDFHTLIFLFLYSFVALLSYKIKRLSRFPFLIFYSFPYCYNRYIQLFWFVNLSAFVPLLANCQHFLIQMLYLNKFILTHCIFSFILKMYIKDSIFSSHRFLTIFAISLFSSFFFFLKRAFGIKSTFYIHRQKKKKQN